MESFTVLPRDSGTPSIEVAAAHCLFLIDARVVIVVSTFTVDVRELEVCTTHTLHTCVSNILPSLDISCQQ